MDQADIADCSFIPVSRPHIWGNEIAYVATAIQSGWLSSQGEFLERFERCFAEVQGRSYAVAVSNGTAALHLALASLGIRPGDEVIVPDFCMIAPILALLYCGATPVPVDVEDTWNIDPSRIAAKVTSKTKAILVVHNYGHPADMRTITAIAKENGLVVIEDAAEALGAKADGVLVGSFGEIACFSFYGNKVITTGEGGMLVTNNSELYAFHRRYSRNS